MHRTPVTSSLIEWIGYDPETRTLEVCFAKNRRTYRYAEVPLEAAAALMGAESIGKHFLQHFKPAGYAYELVAPEPEPAPQAAAEAPSC